ncbi:hypothetical protein CFN78_10570 [Amycolatopsis antarctica]|uniref:PqqD family protein n=2 Tax=Amycolatopsis antarctica TaxID=1854586 RepID=A0A263D4M1_9PSEU|nr:hypothetical protein CFN78_10570 [Amycolatopsis antarctica]
MLAFVRAIQLLLYREHGTTFTMRVVTNRHAGMPYAVMANVDRSYRALRLYDDPQCHMLLVDGNEINTFDVDRPQSPAVVELNRTDILMAGHRTFGDGRPTFCNACNLSVVNSFGLAAAYEGGVDMIVTGDSPQEQRSYYMWILRLAHKLGTKIPRRDERSEGFGGFLSVINDIGLSYFTEIHGKDAHDEIDKRAVTTDVPGRLGFFTIYSDTAYASGDHWDLLTNYLGFVFDDLAFNFTESDCANPALMAHLRALRCERLYGQEYAEGLAEYVRFAISLMRSKEIPERLIEVMRRRYEGPDAPDLMRAAMDEYAMDTFGLTEPQLVSMVYSPFAAGGAGLAAYIESEHPDLADRVPEIRAVLENGDDDRLSGRLYDMTGLSLEQLRTLHRSSLRPKSGSTDGGGMLDVILDGDPHKRTVLTKQDQASEAVPELISGR